MAKEQDLELDCKDLASALGWMSYKGSGHVGAADEVFLKNNHGFVAEIKREKDGKQRRTQIGEEKQCKERGVPYYLIFTLNQFRDAILIEEEKFNSNRWLHYENK